MKSRPKINGSLIKWFVLCFIIFVIAIVVMADLGKMPGFLANLYNFPNGDKVGHFFLMGTLGLLVDLAVVANSARIPVRRLLIAAISIMAVVGLEEASQALFGTRHADWLDLASSWAGILTATGLVVLVLSRSHRKLW